MKKNLSFYLLVAICSLFSIKGFGQLSGSYTIDGASPAGGTNYQTFTAAVAALSSSGVSGAVTFNVQAGTYTEQVSIPAISGASTTNTITFKGLGTSTLLTAAPSATNKPVLSLNSASHITIEDLKIEVTGSTGWGVHFMNQADTNTITGCYIEGPAAAGIFGILASGSVSAGASGSQNNGEYLTITNNTIEGCAASIFLAGQTGPLTTPSKKVNYGTDIIIRNNAITNFVTRAITLNYYHNITIESNTISSSNVDGIGAISCWDAGDNVVIDKNKLYIDSDANNTRVIVLAMAPGNGPAGDATQPCVVSNNFIHYNGINATAPTGLLLKNKAYVKVYNNTFNTNNQGSNANCIWLDANNTRDLDGIEIRNNIMFLENSGSGQFIYNAANGASFKNMVVDRNNYYSPNGYFNLDMPNGTSGTTTFTSFANYQANSLGYGAGALNVDPVFVSATDLHATSIAMGDNAAVISSITTDIDGDVRSATTPDIGADEYALPSCLPSTGMGTVNILGTSADVFFTQSNTGSTFKLQYGVTGFTLGSGIKLTPTNDTVSLTSLTPQTAYDVYVKEVCSATDSSVWTSVSFTTGCSIIGTYPYIEGFEGSDWVSGSSTYNNGFTIDPCWSVSPASGNLFLWGTKSGSTPSTITGPTSGYGGSGNYMYTEGSGSGSTANLTTPIFDLSSLNVPQLSFRYHMYGANIGAMMVWAWNGSAYDTIFSLSGEQGNVWEEAIIDLSTYQYDTTHFVFHGVKGSSYRSDMAIDTIVIDEAPPCPKVGIVTFDGITPNSVNLVFNSPGTKFNVDFGPTGFTQGTNTPTTINGSGDTITGLTPDTFYDFYIQNDCVDSSNGVSPWTGPYTMRTLCSYTNTYFTDWDALADTESDDCWTYLTYGATGAYARAYDPGVGVVPQSFSGNMYYRVYNFSSVSNFLISPEILDLSTNTLQLRFQATDTYTGSTGIPEFYVGTMSSITDTASFTPLDTVATTTDVWTEFIVFLDPVPADHKYVVIRHANNDNYVLMGIDDLYIEARPACGQPSAAVFTDVSDTSLVLSWLAGEGNSFEIEYGTTGFTQGMGTTISGLTDTSNIFTGLLADTCYDFYVRGNCPANYSPWYGPIPVCTECATIIAPFVEDFESSGWFIGSTTTNSIDGCWARTPEAPGSYRWQTNSGTTTSSITGPSSGAGGLGQYVYTEASNGSSDDLAILEMPKVSFSGLTTPTLSFAYHMYGSNINELYVLLNDGTQTDTIWSLSGQQQATSAEDWRTAYVNISTYQANLATISFVGKKGSSVQGDIAIDNVSIDEFPTCITPTGFNLDSVYSNFADFSWSSMSNGTSFKIEYGPAGFSQASGTGTVVYTSASPTRVSSLTPNTSYDIYLADKCDSTTWVGPITFTTLIENDAEIQSIISPSNLVCGDSSYTVEIQVVNNGLNAISSLPVGANITGAVNASITSTYTGGIAPGASAIIPVGTINSYMGGVINIEAYTTLLGDQQTANDTLAANNIEVISAEPLLYPSDSVCVNDTTGQFIAMSQTGVIHNWYLNATDPSPFSIGDTVDVMPNQTLYLDRSKEVDQLIFDIDGFASFGNMFKLYIKEDIIFTGFTFEPASNGTTEPIAFYKQGNWQGFETNRSAWTPIDSASISGGVTNTWEQLMFTTPVTLTAGDTISIYIANRAATKMETSTLPQVTNFGDLYLANDDFEYYAGAIGAYFGSNIATSTAPRAVSSILHYNSNNVCNGNRLAFTLEVKNDTAVASFTSLVDANGADVDFDASASEGHVFEWDFGDGNLGNGELITHTYSVAGSYTTTLVVTDTACGTTDTISKIVMPNVSLDELALNESVQVYPNPNSGTFTVDMNLSGSHDVQLLLSNTFGQVVYRKDLGHIGSHTKAELNINNLAPGVYQLLIQAGQKSAIVKITIL